MTEEDGEVFESLPPQFGTGALGDGFVAAAAASLASIDGPLGVAAVGMFAVLQSHGKHLREEVGRRDGRFFEAAAERADLTIKETLQRITNDERLLILSGIAMDAARRTTLKEKARLLGTSIGAMLEDDAMIDPESVWIGIVALVEPAHVRILGNFLREVPDPATGGRQMMPWGSVKLSSIASDTGLGMLALPLTQTLVQVGLLDHPPTIDGGLPESTFLSGPLDQELRATSLTVELITRLQSEGFEFAR